MRIFILAQDQGVVSNHMLTESETLTSLTGTKVLKSPENARAETENGIMRFWPKD